MIELKALETRFHSVEDVAARGPAHVWPGPHLAEDFGGHHHALTRHLQILQRLPRDLLGQAARIHVRRVDEIDTGIERLADQPLGVGLLQISDLSPHPFATAEGHRAQTEFRNE